LSRSQAKPGQRKTGGILLVLVAACVSVLVAACTGSQGGTGVPAASKAKGGEEASPRERVAGATPGVAAEGNPEDGVVARARAGDAVAGADLVRARAGNTTAKDNGGKGADRIIGGEDRSRKFALKVGGDPGTGFSGTCAVGEAEKAIGDRVPERYVFEPGDARIECEIRKDGEGVLEVVVAGEGVRSVQRTGPGEGTIKLVFSERGTSSSTSSVSLNQTATSPDESGNGSW
jgi:hypothetical protein